MTSDKKAYKGIFTPKNKDKYYGDVKNIIYRSSWERRVMNYLDENKNVIWWSSEELSINYLHPVDKQIHRYYPDFLVRLKESNGKLKTYMLEVKPLKQTKQPTSTRKTKKLLEEAIIYEINQAKWRAADIFCQERGWNFKLITEVDLGLVP